MEDVRIEHRYNASHFKLDNHYENVYQMLLITNGRIRYRVGNKTYETGRGGVIVLNTLEEHELEVLEYPYERYLIRVQPDFFQNEVKYPEVIAAFIKRPPNFSHLLTVSEPIWNYLYDIVLEMEREYNNKKKYWELYVGADLRRIFIIIYRECADMLLMKKTAVVTGSSRGIGFAIAKQLGMDGYNIVMVATGLQEKNQAALDELQALGIACAYVQANIGNQEDRQKILDGALAAFGRVDVLVNNAGVAPKVRADLLDMSEESFDYVVGINTKGNMFLTQLIAKQMIQQEPLDGRKGVIVNVSSCSSVVSSTNRGEYCVSKAGISMLTTLYADRLAAEGILVNEVRPGVIATDMTSKVQGKYDNLIEKGTFPIARWGTPEDVAGAVSLLCSDRLRYTTGNYIDVDGGFHIQRL